MAADGIKERLVGQVRAALARTSPEMREVKMFGGVGFMVQGNLMVAASDRGLLVRVGPPGEAEALARPGASVMVMRGRPMTGYVRVEADGLDARAVAGWLQLARTFVATLPPKAPRKPTTARGAVARPATKASPTVPPKPKRTRRSA